MKQMTDKRLDQRVPKLTNWQKRRAGIMCAEFAAGDTEALNEVLMMLGLKSSPKPLHSQRTQFGRVK